MISELMKKVEELKNHYSDEYGGGTAISFADDAMDSLKLISTELTALEEKHQAQIAMLRKALLLLEPSGDFTGYENADGEKIGMFLNAALSATQQSSI